MDAVERAIRGALEKGNAEDRAFREKVYRSVFTALERNIAANPEVTEDVAQRRREALKAKITQIEQEFQPAMRPVPRPVPEAPAPAAPSRPDEIPSVASVERTPQGNDRDRAPELSVDSPSPARPAPGVRFDRAEPTIPDFAAEPSGRGFSPEPDLAVGASAEERLYDREAGSERRRRRWAATLVAVTVLAALVIGGWWVVETGFFGRPDTSVPNPPDETAEEDFAPEPDAPPLGPGTAEADREWVTVFSPADPVSVTAPTGTRADIMEEEGQSFIRIRSGQGGEAVLFDVGQGILERIAGRRAVFDIIARAEEGQETQIAIECNFAELGDCGRRRYLVGTHRADYLFEIELPAGRPGSAGTIAVVSDVDNAGKAIDVFEIRVSVTN